MIVDAHCHVAEGWYEPGETLLFQMDRCGVDRAWLVQLLGVYDNRYQQSLAARRPDRFLSIVGIDWTLPEAVTELKRSADAGAVGVRLRPSSRSPGDDPLAIWRAAAELRLTVSCVGPATQFVDPTFDALLTELPELPVVLEHLGGLARPDVGDSIAAEPAVAALARHRSIYVKVPGLGQLLPRAALATPESRAAALGHTPLPAICHAFGPDRLMWGSDFPVVSTREGYANALAWTREAVPEPEQRAIFGGTAAAIFARTPNVRSSSIEKKDDLL